MHIETTRTFIKFYKNLPEELKKKTKKAIELIQTDPDYPSLYHKKMAGQEDYLKLFEIRVSKNYRITYQKIGNTAYLRKVGTHDLLRNP